MSRDPFAVKTQTKTLQDIATFPTFVWTKKFTQEFFLCNYENYTLKVYEVNYILLIGLFQSYSTSFSPNTYLLLLLKVFFKLSGTRSIVFDKDFFSTVFLSVIFICTIFLGNTTYHSSVQLKVRPFLVCDVFVL